MPLHTNKSGNTNKLEVSEKTTMDTSRANSQAGSRKAASSVDKENVDLGIGINIRTGALYSEKDDLSSPIHRTEGHFNAEDKAITELEAQLRKPKKRLGKLAALASTINEWENYTSNHNLHDLQTESAAESTSAAVIKTSTSTSNTGGSGSCTNTKTPPPKPYLPSRGRARPEDHTKAQAPQPPAVSSSKDKDPKTKQLKWDPKVLNSVEAQGMQRKETNSSQPENNEPTVKTGLVSGIAAMFESLAQPNTQHQQKPQADPTELSLKELIKLFEMNKGEALVPKAAFGMAPSVRKILKDGNKKKEEHAKASASNVRSVNRTNSQTAHPPLVKADNKLRDKCSNPADVGTASGNLPSHMQPLTSEFSLNKQNENIVKLVDTVSFYRRQQSANSADSTPIQKICREQQVLRSAIEKLESKGVAGDMVAQHHTFGTDGETQSEVVQGKLKKLLEEERTQQQMIEQARQALNLCAANVEFWGSSESVEGERLLLAATHRRQACLDEVQRLRVEKSLRPLGAPKENGSLTVKEITVPLRQDYIRKLATDTISRHHLVCLLKYNEQVLATSTVVTLPGLLAVKFPDVMQLNNAYPDSKVTLEIYGMPAQRDDLPHEVKYHINVNKKSNVKIAKKKRAYNPLDWPSIQGAVPHVLRTPAFGQYGFAIFSLSDIQRTSWPLTQVLDVSPLDGAVHMKVNGEISVSVEYRGFLTIFENILGFGTLHRRWCHLNGTMFNYWKYRDDEKKKTPMGSIDLYTCSSQKVNTAPRDICACPHTMLLECQRPALDSDEESLVIVPNGRTTTVRYLLTADTKEKHEEWCAYFNKALTLLRAWGPPQ